MISLSSFENQISQTEKYLDIIKEYRKYSKKQIEEDLQIKGAMERYLYLTVQSTIDLAEKIISVKELRKPTTMRENFEVLREKNIINKDLAGKLENMVGFRNIIVHDYQKIDYDIVYKILQQELDDIEKFIEIAKSL